MRFRVLMFALLFIAIVLPLPTHGNDSECATVSQNQLAVGVKSRIKFPHEARVHLYANPGERFRRVAALRSGNILHMISGPVCTDGLHWWKVRSDEGLTGWISESKKISFQIQPDIGVLDASHHTPTGANPTFR
jgi:hypothetical protein